MNQNNQPGNGTPGNAKGHFWTSLPGVLTGVSAIIASIGGLVGALFAAGVIGGSDTGAATGQGLPAAPGQVVVATATATNIVPLVATATTFVAAAPVEIAIEGFWVSQGGFSWQIAQTGNQIEVASLDIIGTSYFGTRNGNSVTITQLSDGFSVFPSIGSMAIQANGNRIDVVIGGVPDVMNRQ